ncbi:MAG: peptidylprolyl isomerase [Salinigranum sp.]
MSDEPQAETADDPDDAGEDVAEEETPETEAEAAEEAEQEESGLQNGDFVRLDYTITTVEDETVVDTTHEDVAEDAGIGDDDVDFSPRTIVVGAGHLFQAVDEDLIGKDVGDAGTVEIPAGEAFGEFDPDEVRTVSADRIDEDDRYPGAQVNIDGQQGRVETIIGGRARVNFNHPLAGEDLEYDYEIVDVVEDRIERAEGLLGMYLQQVPEMRIQTDEVEEEVPVEPNEEEDEAEADAEEGDEEADEEAAEQETEVQVVEKETLYIEATPQMTFNQQWLFSKQQIAQDLMTRLDLDRVIIQETIESPGGMMGGLGGMMGGMGDVGAEGLEEAIEDVDIDADELAEELDEPDLEDEE